MLLGCLGGSGELLDCSQLPDIGNFLLEQRRIGVDLNPIQASQGGRSDFVSSSRKGLLPSDAWNLCSQIHILTSQYLRR